MDSNSCAYPINDWNDTLYAKPDCKIFLDEHYNRTAKSGLDILRVGTHHIDDDCHCCINNRLCIGKTETNRQGKIQDNANLVFHSLSYHFYCRSLVIFTTVKQTQFQNILTMKQYFTTTIGRLRLFAFLEGISLLVLVFIAVPLKYVLDNAYWVKNIGPIHGALFLLFIFNALRVGIEQKWKFKETTWKVLVACFIPFGTFYIDYKILRNIKE